MSDIETGGGALTVSDNLWTRDRAGNGVFIKRGTAYYILTVTLYTHTREHTARAERVRCDDGVFSRNSK